MFLINSCIYLDGLPQRERLIADGWIERRDSFVKDWKGLRLTLLFLEGYTGAVVNSDSGKLDFDLGMEAFRLMAEACRICAEEE
jgi:hypothetical protein